MYSYDIILSEHLKYNSANQNSDNAICMQTLSIDASYEMKTSMLIIQNESRVEHTVLSI